MSAPGDVACMWLTLEAAHAYSERMDSEIGQLEQKLATLIAHTRAMREANQSLRRDLVAVQEKKKAALAANEEEDFGDDGLEEDDLVANDEEEEED